MATLAFSSEPPAPSVTFEICPLNSGVSNALLSRGTGQLSVIQIASGSSGSKAMPMIPRRPSPSRAPWGVWASNCWKYLSSNVSLVDLSMVPSALTSQRWICPVMVAT